MKLIDIVNRQPVPVPWSEGEKIPWNDPDFSRRMLREHLTQSHDLASRRFEIIDRHVDWIHRRLLSGKPSRILDLGCGPGLYANRFAMLGHDCTGIDFSPASIAYAQETAQTDHLRCTFVQHDIRTAEYGTGFDLVMLIFGEFNVFSAAAVRLILQKAHQALKGGGVLLLEPHTYATVCKVGTQAPSWYAANSGLFSDGPHLCLTENFWDAEQAIATQRYFVVNAVTGDVTRHASSMQAYTDEQYRSVLEASAFEAVTFYPSLDNQATTDGLTSDLTDNFVVIVSRKPPVD